MVVINKTNCEETQQNGSYTQKSRDKEIFDGVDELIKQRGQRKLKEEMRRKCLGRCRCDCSSCSDCIAK